MNAFYVRTEFLLTLLKTSTVITQTYVKYVIYFIAEKHTTTVINVFFSNLLVMK